MGKRFVKNRYPNACARKYNYGANNPSPWKICSDGNRIQLLTSGKDEKEAWENVTNLIKKNEAECKGLNKIELEARRLRIIAELEAKGFYSSKKCLNY